MIMTPRHTTPQLEKLVLSYEDNVLSEYDQLNWTDQ